MIRLLRHGSATLAEEEWNNLLCWPQAILGSINPVVAVGIQTVCRRIKYGG